jgi:phosphoglycerate dehydrogenase-like enzyme
MGHRVIYYGEHDDARTIRALELGPDDLDWGVVSPDDPEDEQTAALADAVAIITNGPPITTEQLVKMPRMKLLQVMSAGFIGSMFQPSARWALRSATTPPQSPPRSPSTRSA